MLNIVGGILTGKQYTSACFRAVLLTAKLLELGQNVQVHQQNLKRNHFSSVTSTKVHGYTWTTNIKISDNIVISWSLVNTAPEMSFDQCALEMTIGNPVTMGIRLQLGNRNGPYSSGYVGKNSHRFSTVADMHYTDFAIPP